MAASPDKGSFAGPLSVGFGSTVALWTAAYVCHMPLVQASAPATLWVLLACLFLAGLATGRLLGSAPRQILTTGLISGLLNLLVLGSFLAASGKDARPNQLLPWAPLWIIGSLLLSILLIWGGAALASRGRSAPPPPADGWNGRFARVLVVAAALVLLAGGLVTGNGAGLAVKDWPTSFASNMFLFPLSRMTGAIFYEHAHRLLGSLVGLGTLVFTILVLKGDDRSWMRRLAGSALLIVILQGVLGGFRVTSAQVGAAGVAHLTAHNETTSSITLRIVHGVLAQLFFCLTAALAAFTSKGWRHPKIAGLEKPALDTKLIPWAAGALLVQLILGALVRHLGDIDQTFRSQILPYHVILGLLLVVLLAVLGTRTWKRSQKTAPLPRLGAGLFLLAVIQLFLGLTAFMVTSDPHTPLAQKATLTTLHQVVGALLMAGVLLLGLWSRRLLKSPRADALPFQEDMAA